LAAAAGRPESSGSQKSAVVVAERGSHSPLSAARAPFCRPVSTHSRPPGGRRRPYGRVCGKLGPPATRERCRTRDTQRRHSTRRKRKQAGTLPEYSCFFNARTGRQCRIGAHNVVPGTSSRAPRPSELAECPPLGVTIIRWTDRFGTAVEAGQVSPPVHRRHTPSSLATTTGWDRRANSHAVYAPADHRFRLVAGQRLPALPSSER